MKENHSSADLPSPDVDWGLWFYWISATTSGWLIGNILFTGIPFIISGVLIAAMQWAVLYKRVEKAWQWFALSSFAWMISMILIVSFLPGVDLLSSLVLGGMLGLTQWALLRRSFYWAGWWIPISILAWTTGLVLIPGLFSSGALPGALTGITLVIFFRFAAKPEQEREE